MMEPLFKDRAEAGRRLAEALMHLGHADPVVLALPRGGVPIGAAVAHALAAPLDLVLVRKIGAPGQPELALGAIVDGDRPEVVLNGSIVAELGDLQDYIAEEGRRQLRELERRRRRYLGERPRVPVTGRTAVVVDDGIATGATMEAALHATRRTGPPQLVLAVPVAPSDTIERLRAQVGEVVCLARPHVFYAIGAFYADFTQVSDEEVVALLKNAACPRPVANSS